MQYKRCGSGSYPDCTCWLPVFKLLDSLWLSLNGNLAHKNEAKISTRPLKVISSLLYKQLVVEMPRNGKENSCVD
jgi:hypothetical protein